MKILMSHLPLSNWWGKGTPVYENNWSMTLGKIPDADITKTEHAAVVNAVKKNSDLLYIPFPNNLDTKKIYKHDAVFVRDSFISNQKGDIVMSNYAAKERQKETQHLRKFLLENNYTVHDLSENAYAEGGEFYYVAKQNLLFAGNSRNNKKGITETAKYLSVTTLFIVKSKAYHLDTVLTIILDKTGNLAGIIACLALIQSSKELKKFAKSLDIPLIDILPNDAIDTDGMGKIAVNCLPLPGVLIGGGTFDTPGVETKIRLMKIKHIINPVTQFHLSGGGTHCLTNELLL